MICFFYLNIPSPLTFILLHRHGSWPPGWEPLLEIFRLKGWLVRLLLWCYSHFSHNVDEYSAIIPDRIIVIIPWMLASNQILGLKKKIILPPLRLTPVFISHTHVHEAVVESNAKLRARAEQIHKVFCQCSNQGKCLTNGMELAGLFINFPHSTRQNEGGKMRVEDMREHF